MYISSLIACFKAKKLGLIVTIALSFLIVFSSCKSISVQDKRHRQTTQKILLTHIGEDDDFILESSYTPIGSVKLNKPIEIVAYPTFFNKSSHTAFKKAQRIQNEKLQIEFSDTTDTKTYFLNLEILDKISLIDQINSSENYSVKSYLQHQNNSHIITGLSISFEKELLSQINQADALYLDTDSNNTLVISILNASEPKTTIQFNEGVIFSYRKASACWRESSKASLEIIDLVEGDKGCPSKSYRISRRAKQKINYYKF